jgi:hypothetical protein
MKNWFSDEKASDSFRKRQERRLTYINEVLGHLNCFDVSCLDGVLDLFRCAYRPRSTRPAYLCLASSHNPLFLKVERGKV